MTHATKSAMVFALGLVLLAVLTPSASLCQTTSGSIVGRVTDTTGASLVGAEVELVNEGTMATSNARTNADGDYVFTNVPPGSYCVSVKAPGMQSRRIEGLRVAVLQTVRQDVSLNVGQGPAEHITVTAETPVIQTEKPTISNVIDGRQIEETPLNGRTNAYQLMGLAPGVQRPNSNALIAGSSFTGGTTMTIDGIATNDLFNSRMAGPIPSLDAVAEFTVIVNNASAEFGRGGAQVVMQTKSGTNEFHGSVFEFNRNRATQARNFFLAPATPNPPFNRNEFGGSFGGPIRRDKLFFFGAIEDYRMVTSAVRRSAMPPTAFLSGDFSGYPQNVVYDPTSGVPFPGNRIPENRISPISKKFLAYYSEPNIPTPNGLGTNFTCITPTFEKHFRASERTDYLPNSADRFMVRWFVSYNGPYRSGSGGSSDKFGSFAGTGTRVWNIAGNWTRVITPSIVNEAVFGVNKEEDPRLDQNHNVDPGSLVPGLPSPPPGRGGLPTINISNLAAITSAGSNFNNRHYILQGNDNLSVIRGKHTIKTGGQFLQQRTGQGGVNLGSFTFDGRYTRRNTGAVNAVNGFADFLLGYMTTSTRATSTSESRTLGNSLGLYATDNWQVSRNLTLNLGIRWEKYFPLGRTLGGVANFYPELDNGQGALAVIKGTPSPLLENLYPTITGASVGINMGNYTHTSSRNFSPRIGFAYRPFGASRLVVRGGYSLIYNYFTSYMNGLHQVPFFAVLTYSAAAGATPTLSFADPFPTATVSKGFPSLTAVPRSLQTPYQQHWNFTIEQEFLRATALRITYLGNLGTHLYIPVNLNDTGQVQVPSGRSLQDFRPYATWGTISKICFCSSTNTNQLQIGIRRRFNRLTFAAEYQWTKALGLDGANSGAPTDKNNWRYDYGNLDFYRRHYFTLNYSYDLPFGAGRLSGGKAVNKVVSGWRFSGVFLAQSGEPLSINFSPNLTGWIGNRASVIPGVDPYADQNINRWFNLAAFTAPAPYAFGNTARNAYYGPSYWNLDAALSKEIAVTEKVKLNIRAESFNVLNHTSFAAPARNISNPNTFGQITSTANQARQFSFSARLKF